MAVFDAELRCVASNDGLARLIDLPLAAHRGRTLLELCPGLPPEMLERARGVLATGTPVLGTEVVIAPPGQRPRRWVASFHRVEGEGPAGEVGVGFAAQELGARGKPQERLDLLLEAKEILSTTLDYDTVLDRLVRLLTPRLADFCAVDLLDDAGELQLAAIGHREPDGVALVRDLRRHNPPRVTDRAGAMRVTRSGRAERYRDVTDEVLVAGARSEEHLRLLRALGLRSSMVVPMRTPERTLGAITFVSTDADRRYEEDDLALAQAVADRAALAIDNARLHDAERRARLAAEQANRTKDDFLGIVSHELRTPLNAVLGWATLLQGRAADPAFVARGLATIERNARAQVKIIEDILDVSRLVSGKLAIDREHVDAAAVLRAAIEPARLAAEAKGIAIEVRVDDEVPAILGDAGRLQQVFANLLSNAVKFTSAPGRVRVALTAGRSEVRLDVADTGMGIEPDVLPRVFDRFWQADSSRTRRHPGLGLGLAIVKHLVELQGGRVSVESEGAGKGARFTVRLPVPESATEAPSPEADDEDGPPQSIERLRVLVVDDEPDARETVAAILSASGAIVHAVGSADAAIDALPEFEPDVLLSDIGMPGEDGFALLRRVRSLPSPHAQVAAIAVTAFAGDEDATRVMAAGFLSHLPKPIEAARVIATVARAAGRAG